MQRELQQEIMGYYIEETKDSLNTIEHHLLNLPSKLDEHQIIDPLLCASNSLVGGAAMLGIDSISRASCCLKSCFQLLQLECPLKVDQELKDLFIQVFHGLKDLVEHLNHPAGLTEDKAAGVMSRIEPVMGDLVDYINLLIKRSHDDDRANIDEDFISLFDELLLGSN